MCVCVFVCVCSLPAFMPPFVPDFTRLLTLNSTLDALYFENRDPLFYRVARKRRHAPTVIHLPLVHSSICIFIYSLVWN